MQVVVDLVQLVGGDDLNLRLNAVLVAEVDHLLSVGHPADAAAREANSVADQRHLMHLTESKRKEVTIKLRIKLKSGEKTSISNLVGLVNEPELDDSSVLVQEAEVVLSLVGGGDRVQNQVERLLRFLHGFLVSRNHEIGGADRLRDGLLGRAGGDGGHGATHGLGQPDAHLTQTADANDSNPKVALVGSPVLKICKAKFKRVRKQGNNCFVPDF